MSENLSFRTRVAVGIARLIGGPAVAEMLAQVSVRVDDSRGWERWGGGRHDRDPAEIQQLYQDALTAWRKNPMAKRIIDITTDYCLGDGIRPVAAGEIGKFIDRWWEHPQNRMELRLQTFVFLRALSGLNHHPYNGINVRPN